MILERHRLISMPPFHHPAAAGMQRDPGAGDRGRARAAIGLEHVAIDRDLPLAEALQIGHGAQSAADQPLDLLRAARLLAAARLAPHALVRRARQHAVFGASPSPALCPSARAAPFFEGSRHQHMRVAEFGEARAFRIFDRVKLQSDAAQIGVAALVYDA